MEQCSTVTEAVTSVVEETSFETQCAMVSDRLVQLINKKKTRPEKIFKC